MSTVERWQTGASRWLRRLRSDARHIDFESAQIFYELDELAGDRELLALMTACLEAQKAAGAEVLRDSFRPHPDALREVSQEALEAILRTGKDVSDIRSEQNLSNCLVFNVSNIAGGVSSREVISLRKDVDRAMSRRLKRLFRDGGRLSVVNSGHFWYPPGGYMGWHTNLKNPGWRLYSSYCDEPGNSFFRYRNPDTGAIVTSMDRRWHFRLFRITSEKPLWHAVYSQTNRFSVGYKITVAPPTSVAGRLRARWAHALG
jgi:hypothetical protein